MITLVGMFAKARTYVVQVRPYSRRRRNPEAGWLHASQFNYDGKYVTKHQAEIRAEMYRSTLAPHNRHLEYRVVNMTVKQAHKAKTANYRPDGELKKLRPEFDYDKKCARHPKLAWTPNKRKTDEHLGATALANPIRNENDTNKKSWDRLRRAMAYYELAQNY